MKEVWLSLFRILPFLVLLGVIGWNIRKGKIDPVALDLKKPASTGRFAGWLLGFLFFALLVEGYLYQIGVLEISAWRHSWAPSIPRIIGAVILAPAAEELLFRGVLLNELHKRLSNKYLAIAVQALLFVAVHSFAYDQSLSAKIGIVQTFTDACLFALARYHTGSLYTPMAMHATGNLIATLERFSALAG